MARLTKAQLKVLDEIRNNYETYLERGLAYHREKLAAASEAWEIDYHKERIAKYEEGYITWESKNSRTLEVLQERGYIDYIKNDDHVARLNIDYLRLR